MQLLTVLLHFYECFFYLFWGLRPCTLGLLSFYLLPLSLKRIRVFIIIIIIIVIIIINFI